MITCLPPLDKAQVATQIKYLLDQSLIPAIEYARKPPRDHYWNMWKLPSSTHRRSRTFRPKSVPARRRPTRTASSS